MWGMLNWEWDGENDLFDFNFGVLLNIVGWDLVQDVIIDVLVIGKFVYFFYIGLDNWLCLNILIGFLWFIYEVGDVSEVQVVL